MREIKFRARTNNCWINEGMLIFRFNDDKLILRQFTGLQDKNGVDIYEGDIMKFITNSFDSETFVTSVPFKNCSFQLANNRALFYFGQSDLTRVDDGEIIGNIYENPELMIK